MKTMLLLSTLALSTCFSAIAQTGAKPTDYDGTPVGMIAINDSVALFRFGQPWQNQREHLAVVDRRGKEVGSEILLPDNVIGMARYNGDFVVFYAQGKKSAREVHALVIDLNNRKAGLDKVVCSVASEYLTRFTVERDAAGNFQGILARTTRWKKEDPFGEFMDEIDPIKDYYETTGLTYTTLQGQPEPRTVSLSSVITQGTPIGSAVDKQGNLFVVSVIEGQLVAEKFGPSGKMEQKLSAAFSPRKVELMRFVVRSDDNAVSVAFNYENEHKDNAAAAFRFDFSDRKAYVAQEDVLDKSYYKTLKAAGVRTDDIERLEDLIPVDIVTTKDQVVVCKDIELTTASSGSDAHFWSDAAIISIYDKKMHLLHAVTLDKTVESFISFFPAIDVHVEGDKLYALTTEKSGPASMLQYKYVIDLQTGAMDKEKLERSGLGTGVVIAPQFTYWCKDGFLVSYIFKNGLLSRKFGTDFVPAQYMQK